MRLTAPQVDALRTLADGVERETWRQRTMSNEHVTRINQRSAASLSTRRLVRLSYSWGGQQRVKITEAGLARLAEIVISETRTTRRNP